MDGRLYYNESNPYGCNENNKIPEDLRGEGEDQIVPIFLVKQGECSFVTQTRNIENSGGAMALIIDVAEEDISDIIVSDDGTGAGIRIPAMLINKNDGASLINFLAGNGIANKKGKDKYVSLTAEFLIPISEDNVVDATLWYSSSDDRSLDFIKNMKYYIEPIITQVNFEPKFVTWACPHCDSDSKRENCVSDGKYCAMQHDANVDMAGADVVMENLRQHCLY